MDAGAGSEEAVDRMVTAPWSQDESMLWFERGLALLCLAIGVFAFAWLAAGVDLPGVAEERRRKEH